MSTFSLRAQEMLVGRHPVTQLLGDGLEVTRVQLEVEKPPWEDPCRLDRLGGYESCSPITVQGSTSGVRIVTAISPSSPVVGEALFQDMAERDYATSTINRTWNYLNQACQHSQRARGSDQPGCGCAAGGVPAVEASQRASPSSRPRS